MAATYDIPIEQGILFKKSFKWSVLTNPQDDPTDPDSPRTPVDMTGMEAKSVIRSRDGELLGEFSCTVNGVAGEVVLGLSDIQSAALDFDMAISDIDIYQAGVRIKRLLRLTLTLCRDVEDV